MDTKSRSINYSRGAKFTAAFIIWLCSIIAVGSLFLFGNYGEYIRSNNYYDTYRFQDSFSNLVHNAVEMNVVLRNEESIRNSGNHREVISDNLSRLRRAKNNISQAVNFLYLLKNTETGEIITNVPESNAESFINSQKYFVYANKWEDSFYNYLQDDISAMLANTPYEVTAAVRTQFIEGDSFYDEYKTYTLVKQYYPYCLGAMAASILIAIITFIYLACVTGRHEKGGGINFTAIDRLYTDVSTVLIIIIFFLSLDLARSMGYIGLGESLITVMIIFAVDMVIALVYLLSIIRQIKGKRLFKHTLIYKILLGIFKLFLLCFSGRLFKPWLLILLLVYAGINSILFGITVTGGSIGVFIFLQLPLNIAVLYFASKSLLSLTTIMEASREISSGNLDYPLDSTKISAVFKSFSQDIQSIQGGLKKAVQKAIKDERMKTDLITNVSHDLKTPLTSIINYVDLLKKEELDNETAAGYVAVLDEKSSKLKTLIEDLMEASKASSGNLSVKEEKIVLNELITQSVGEYEEKLNAAGLDIRISEPEEKIYVAADGSHMWRIVGNLLSNVAKYSMANSRVYINIDKNGKYGTLTIKNMSAHPLNISPDQLTERFVRGDESRTTEGSGLGLSIAQSLITLQGGKFSIDIDGDLFKATLSMPLYM
ncbi:sensor protein kinase WalK [Oxobacter pfennigii]|uniref:histidine kinase n=1 Tax=Oxobacter pfennigii TaxID=36849 RepID=A0A0P8W4A9_9CLOT|nr:sensor histidine kinase [Oxobacter pfennigii]KPU42508.1 sensor protein kinase WalK [Oxobacter pfennigii]